MLTRGSLYLITHSKNCLGIESCSSHGGFDLCSMGAASCKQAVQLVGSIFEKVEVIYAQTDSVFAHFKDVSIEEAIKLGTQAAEIVSQAFPSPIVLKFERVRISEFSQR